MSRPTSPTDSTAIPDVVVESPHGSSRSKSVKARSWLQRKIGRGHNEGLSASQAGGSSKSSATSLAAEEDDELPVLRTAAEMKADTNTNTKGDTKVVEDSNTANMDTDTGKDAVQKVLASRSISVSERSLSDGMGNSKKPLTPRSKSTLNKPSVSQNISASSMLEDTHEEMDDISIGKDGKSGQGFRSGVMDRIRRRKKEVSPMSVDTLGNSTFNNSLTPRPYKNHALQQNVGFGKMSNSLNGPRDASGGNSYLRTGGGTVLSINSMTIQGKSPSLHSRTWSAESNSTGASAAFTNTNAKRSTSMLAHMKESERLDVGMNGANAVEEVSFEGSRNEGDQSSQQVTGRDAGGDGVRTENTGLQESRQFIDWGYRAAIAAFFITLFLAVLKEVGYDIVPKVLEGW
ncbi:hypothetical protein SARC_04684 [Sphaeroforma arctica JP610]|uniref:Uncharacterized protein n=1 Tax=Sphaeroforma arctica JP610 TaxID=667725 RepID=A0A0L0G2I1_9EUKA|nr:hypothetical protein SARC_04684 [Sphaeroforma arctica JP610]KNC83036.1 hypothetical protein SARC_04684 [Sphaeroforma arctica JP610]|eukprot:XP_014156938.1 hypothetical protein SARC_04684 [Sphaeroforma arctica JP610]